MTRTNIATETSIGNHEIQSRVELQFASNLSDCPAP